MIKIEGLWYKRVYTFEARMCENLDEKFYSTQGIFAPELKKFSGEIVDIHKDSGGDFWICEDDNCCLTEEMFEEINKVLF